MSFSAFLHFNDGRDFVPRTLLCSSFYWQRMGLFGAVYFSQSGIKQLPFLPGEGLADAAQTTVGISFLFPVCAGTSSV